MSRCERVLYIDQSNIVSCIQAIHKLERLFSGFVKIDCQYSKIQVHACDFPSQIQDGAVEGIILGASHIGPTDSRAHCASDASGLRQPWYVPLSTYTQLFTVCEGARMRACRTDGGDMHYEMGPRAGAAGAVTD